MRVRTTAEEKEGVFLLRIEKVKTVYIGEGDSLSIKNEK